VKTISAIIKITLLYTHTDIYIKICMYVCTYSSPSVHSWWDICKTKDSWLLSSISCRRSQTKEAETSFARVFFCYFSGDGNPRWLVSYVVQFYNLYIFSSIKHSHACIHVQSDDMMMIRNDNETGWFEWECEGFDDTRHLTLFCLDLQRIRRN